LFSFGLINDFSITSTFDLSTYAINEYPMLVIITVSLTLIEDGFFIGRWILKLPELFSGTLYMDNYNAKKSRLSLNQSIKISYDFCNPFETRFLKTYQKLSLSKNSFHYNIYNIPEGN